jgi:hypothetical protein
LLHDDDVLGQVMPKDLAVAVIVTGGNWTVDQLEQTLRTARVPDFFGDPHEGQEQDGEHLDLHRWLFGATRQRWL